MGSAFDLTGETLKGRYRIEGTLGKGGMGVVYDAVDAVLDTRVVVKVPHARFLDDPEFLERFEREVRSLTRLEHPHVVRVVDAGTLDRPTADGSVKVPYAVLQHLAGGSLKDRLTAAGGRLPPSEVASWLVAIADTLDHIHAEGIVHRDVKPGNVLFDKRGNVFLADFGIAKALGTPDTGLTQTGMTPGSPDYMAPEAGSGTAIGPPYDQYALAVVIYQALSGKLPHTGTNPLVVVAKKAYEDPAPLAPLAPNVPRGAVAAVMRALARDPAQRFPTCAAFAKAFVDGLVPRRKSDEARPASDVMAPTRRVVGGSAGAPSHAPGSADGLADARSIPPRPSRLRLVGATAAVVVLGIAAVVFGPRLFASKAPGAPESARRDALPAAREEGRPVPAESPRPFLDGSGSGEIVPRADSAPVPGAPRDPRGEPASAPRTPAQAESAPAPAGASAERRPTLTVEWSEPSDGSLIEGDRVPVRGEIRGVFPQDSVTVDGVEVSKGPGPFRREISIPAEGEWTLVLRVVAADGETVGEPLRRTIVSRKAWRRLIARALDAAEAADWVTVRRLTDEAGRLGATVGDVPVALRDGLAAYDAPPVVEVTAPAGPGPFMSLDVVVEGAFRGRKSDEIFVDGAVATRVGSGFRATSRLPAWGRHDVKIEVRDGIVLRGSKYVRVVVRDPAKRAPEFRRRDLDGKERSLSEFVGKVVVLEFIGAHCPFEESRYREGMLGDFQRRYVDREVVWLAIDSNVAGSIRAQTAEQWREWMTRFRGNPSAVLLDPESDVAMKFNARTTLDFRVVDRDGFVAYAGALDSEPGKVRSSQEVGESYLLDALEAVLGGSDPDRPETKSYG